jgi:hypothetical protein
VSGSLKDNFARIVTGIGALIWSTVVRDTPRRTIDLFQMTWKVPIPSTPMTISQGISFRFTNNNFGLMIKIPTSNTSEENRSLQKAKPTGDTPLFLNDCFDKNTRCIPAS